MNAPRENIRDRARGRWRDILQSLGVLNGKVLQGRHGPCPMCGGKDRFHFDNKEGRGTWICNSPACGAGDGVQLVMRHLGLEFREAVQRIESVIGDARVIHSRPAATEEANKEACANLWRGAVPIVAGDVVDRYLRSRGVTLEVYPPSLRRHGTIMLARVTAPEGHGVTLHRTFLTSDGGKADIEMPRMLMPGAIAEGSAVRLGEPAEEIGIAEGLETAFSASALFGLRVDAALNTALLAKWLPPPGVKRVRIFGDNDPTFAGQAAAWALAHRLRCHERLGVEVKEVSFPLQIGTDWNDVLQAPRQSRTEPEQTILEHERA